MVALVTHYDSSRWWRILLDYFYEYSLLTPVEMIDYTDIAEPSSPGGGTPTKQYYLAVSANPQVGGTVTGTGYYDKGTVPSNVVGQTASSGYTFKSWQGPVSTPMSNDVNLYAIYEQDSSGGGGSGGSKHPFDEKATYRFTSNSDGTISVHAFETYQIAVPQTTTDKDGKKTTTYTKKTVTNLAAIYTYDSSFQLANTSTNPNGYSPPPPVPPPPNIKFDSTSSSEQTVEIQTSASGWSKLATVYYDSEGDVKSITFDSPFNKSQP